MATSSIPATLGAEFLIPISLTTLPLGTAVEVDIYLKTGSDQEAALFCAAGQVVQRGRFEKVLSCGVSRLYIATQDRDAYQLALRENLNTTLNDERRPVIERIAMLQEVIRDVLQSEFTYGNTDSIVEACQNLGPHSARLLSSQPVLLNSLSRVLHHDYGTFTHSANVSAYAQLLGSALGFPHADLERIAVGGLLHDLGKLDIDDRILNKPGRLDESERRIIETHPTLGINRVADRHDLSEGEFMMIYQHHERFDGTGYPVGLEGYEVHPWAQICAIVDVFEALTSNRPYRNRLSHATALAVLEKNECCEFNAEMVSCWRQLMLS